MSVGWTMWGGWYERRKGREKSKTETLLCKEGAGRSGGATHHLEEARLQDLFLGGAA